MSIWWGSLSGLQQILALFAIPASVVLILQTLLLLFGLGGQGEADGGADMGGQGEAGGEAGLDSQDIAMGPDAVDHASHETLHDSGLRVFTVRAFVAFFSIFGWLGIALLDGGMNTPLAITLAIIGGAAAMVGLAFLFKSALRLQSSGNIDIRNSLGKTATVYIPIPPNRTGKGKVNLTVQGRYIEVDAVTDSDLRLKTGAEVVAVSVSNQNVLCVAPMQAQNPNNE